MCVFSRTRNLIHRTRACCSWQHLLVRPNRGRRLAMLYRRWRLHSTKIGLRQIAINVALSAWMMFVFSSLPCSSLTCERFCSTRPLILCSNSLIVLIGFTGIVFRWVICCRYWARNMLTERILFSNGLEGQALVLFVVNPSTGPLLPDKVDCHHRQSKISRIICRSAPLGDVARHRLARDPAVTVMLLVLGRGDKLLFFWLYPHYGFDLRFPFTF